MEEEFKEKTSYLPQLDGLRGLAILSVLAHHYNLSIPRFLDWGPIGVSLFFILSGYFITISLWKAQKTSLENAQPLWIPVVAFQMKRFLRIAPVFWLSLGIAALLQVPEVTQNLHWHLPFLTNFYIAAQGFWPEAVSHFWSLSVQEQFYLVWPFIILLLPRRWFLPAACACIAVAMLYRSGCLFYKTPTMIRWVMLPGSLDAFAAGGILAWIVKNRPEWISGKHYWALAFGIFAIGCFILAHWLRFGPEEAWEVAFIDLLEVIFLTWVVFGTIRGWSGLGKRLFESSLLIYIGKLSLGIYVYHILVRIVLRPWLNTMGWTVESANFFQYGVLTVATIVVAKISWNYFEMPMARGRVMLIDWLPQGARNKTRGENRPEVGLPVNIKLSS
ncbi:MAG: acyltransferase [Chthoniobacterales bacterium]